MNKRGEKAKRGAGEKLRRGWTLVLIVLIAIPLCLLLSRGRVESGQHMEPGYTKEEPGRWDRTDARVIGPSEGSGDVSASFGEDALVYDFDGEGGRVRVTLHTQAPEELFYAGDRLVLAFPMEREAEGEETPGDIRCMFYLADGVTEADCAVTVDVREPFRYAYSGEKDMEPISYENALTQKERHSAVANAWFPEGQGDGETLYVVMDVSDDRDAGVRTVAAWQYRWTQGPITVEVPPEPGVIEYYRAYSPLDIALRVFAFVLIAALAVLLARQFVLAVRARKERADVARRTEREE